MLSIIGPDRLIFVSFTLEWKTHKNVCGPKVPKLLKFYPVTQVFFIEKRSSYAHPTAHEILLYMEEIHDLLCLYGKSFCMVNTNYRLKKVI